MRISDSMLTNSFLNSLSSSKSKVQNLQTELATSKKINTPSDSPIGASRLIRYNGNLNANDTFKSNIENSLSFVNQTTTGLESLQSDTTNALTLLTQAVNPTNSTNLGGFADQLDQLIKSMMNTSNSQFEGKYIFGGTDQSTKPYGFTSDSQNVEVKSGSVSGEQNVKITPNISQKINMTGTEIFGTIVKASGNLDSGSAIGATSSGQTKIYDANGNEYTLITNYKKTAANTYDLTYDIQDGTGNSVLTSVPAAKQLIFNSDGSLKSIDGSSPSQFNIKVSDKKIDFNFDLDLLNEKNQSASLTFSANQKTDIFNTLISIRDSLRNGNAPTEDQINLVNNFNSHLLDKIAENGNVSNQLNDTGNLLDNQKLEVQKLISNEQDVDVAQAVMDLQNQEYLMQLSYKISSMVLPKSLLDYL